MGVSLGLATAVSDKCLVPVLHVLREDKTTSPRHRERVAKLLAALMNLVSVNKEAREMLVRLKALPTVVPFLTAYREGGSRPRFLRFLHCLRSAFVLGWCCLRCSGTSQTPCKLRRQWCSGSWKM